MGYRERQTGVRPDADGTTNYSTSTPVQAHEWKAPFSAASNLCGAMVMRAGGGDECGLPRDHPTHSTASAS